MLGYLALRRALPGRLAGVASTLSIVGLIFLVPLFGVSGVAFPALGRAGADGDAAAITTAAAAFGSRAVLVLFGFTVLNWVGHVLFAVALWRSRVASRAASLASGAMLAAPLLRGAAPAARAA